MIGQKEGKGQIKPGSKNSNEEKLEKKMELHENGKMKFDGYYLNGKRHGKGTEYDNNCNIIFEGNYLNGERHGEGKEYYNSVKPKKYYLRENIKMESNGLEKDTIKEEKFYMN